MTDEIQNAKPNIPWYWKKTFVIIMLLSVLPLALPLVIWNPHFSKKEKIVWTVVTLLLTWFSIQACMMLGEQYQKSMADLKQLGF